MVTLEPPSHGNALSGNLHCVNIIHLLLVSLVIVQVITTKTKALLWGATQGWGELRAHNHPQGGGHKDVGGCLEGIKWIVTHYINIFTDCKFP